VTLRIFSLEGALVRTLLNGHVAAGPGVVEWDGRSDRGRDVPAGVYFYRLSGPDFEVSRKIVKQD
jgi:flagellar hook assembly protein FlgD